MKRTAIIVVALLVAQNGGAAAQTYRIGPDSRLEVRVGKAGILAGAGHEHVIRARSFSGTITYRPDDPRHASVAVTVPTEGLYVVSAADSGDIPKITATMRKDVLKVAANPEITFVSTSVRPADHGVRVEGDFTMMGRTRPVAFNATLNLSGDTLEGTAAFAVKQTDFGIHPYSKALGLVKVADEVHFEMHLRGTRN